jgi:hypothetical protein
LKVSITTQEAVQNWYESRKTYAGGIPAKGTMAGALVLFEHLKEDFDLSIDAHTASGGTQIRGVSGTAVKNILETLGETRPFVSEGGRTNRGLRKDMVELLDALETSGLDGKKATEREAVLHECQRFIVDRIRDFHSQQRIKIVFQATGTMRDLVRQILKKAKEKGQTGQVAQYLVGAKLALRFPALEISNDSYSTADQQLGRAGDFLVGDTAFHVTMTPMDKVYDRCKQNADQGLRSYLLVPDEHVQSARTIVKERLEGRVSVESIESFVGQNIEELGSFSNDRIGDKIFELLTLYNKRVKDTEIDLSVMIDIPSNLAP